MVVKRAITEGKVRSAPKKESKAQPIKNPPTAKPKNKPKFDVYDFVFRTKLIYVLNWMRYMEEELDDVNSEWLDGETYDLYAVWLRDINHYLNNNITWTLLSSRERYLMGIYRPDTKTSLDDNDKP